MRAIVISRRRCLLAGLAVAASVRAMPARTPPLEVAAGLPGARLRGQGRLTWFGLHVYDARLWSAATSGQDVQESPFALELEYARSLRGERIADRSIEEMARIGDFAADRGARWLATMKQLFPDIAPGDRLTGMQRTKIEAQFFHNGVMRGSIADADFTRLFFGIWLSPRTSAPGLREQLLGMPASATP
jgi:hypothetical protein